MKLTLTALTVAAALTASGASAFDPEDVLKLLDTGNCFKCDLTEADLSGTRLINANLSGANLSKANLSGANLSETFLNYAIMNGAILCNTTMPDGSVIYSGC